MLVAIVPLIFAVAALIVYFAVEKNGKVSEIARLTYFAAIFITLWAAAKHVVKLM